MEILNAKVMLKLGSAIGDLYGGLIWEALYEAYMGVSIWELRIGFKAPLPSIFYFQA